MSNEFWTYSLTSYAEQGVAESCLAVQDQWGLDVNLVLYASWLASIDRRLNEAHLAALNSLIAPWREAVVLPLRGVRRYLRELPEAQPLREGVKSLELQAEQKQQDMMWDFFRTGAGDTLPVENRPLSKNLALLITPANTDQLIWTTLTDRLSRTIGL
jgi:uncharacterized protein (TIGR02444 family)